MILDKLKSILKKPNPHLADNIKDIGMTDKTYHTLRRAGIVAVGDLVQLSWKDVSGIRGAVRRTGVEVEKVLKGLGLGLREGDK